MSKMKNKKYVTVIAIVAVLLIAGIAVYWNPNGEIIEGKVTSWLDFDQSDTVQITMNGKTYLTHYMNVCLIDD